MRVGINATCLNDRPSGARQRFVGLYGELFRRLPETEFVIFEPRDCEVARWFEGQHNVASVVTPVPSTGRWRKLGANVGFWRRVLSRESFDVFEALHLPLVRPRGGAALLTVHDVRGLQPDSGVGHRAMFSMALRRALERADHVVTVSAAMRDEILAFYSDTPVSVVYNGLEARAFGSVRKADCEGVLRKHGLPEEFVLAVGHLESRKNYARLIEAIALLRKRGLDVPLVIVGNDSGEGKSLARQIAALKMQSRVRLLSGLSDLEVRCVYVLCRLLAFPSMYEGFGIPILEAMAAARPMVLSDLPVFREITEGKAIYFAPEGVEAMAGAVELGLTSSQDRERMVQYGVERVTDFSFPRLAGGMADVYAKVSGSLHVRGGYVGSR
jgi:glycosyltransferase involved in cell wall biosynthesis